MGRAPCCEKAGLKRGRWTAEEDDILTKYIQSNGEGNWRCLPKNAGLLRCGKSCRLRWVNYLKSDLKRGNFSTDEDETIIKLHSSLGNRWCLIATHLPGRTDNEIKNYWHSHLSRQIYNYRKIIKELKQQVIVVHPPKSGSTNIARQPRVGGTSKSAMKKIKSKFPTELPNPTPKKLVEKSIEVTTSSQEVENGGGALLMPSTPALEKNVTSSMLLETMDDIFLDYDFSNIEFDGLETGPTVVPSLQTSSQLGDQNGEILFTNAEVENWLMGDDTTVQTKSEPSIISNTKYGATPRIYPNEKFDTLEWGWQNLDMDGEVAGDELRDTEDHKLESDLNNISSYAESGARPSFNPNDELDCSGWDWDNLDLDGQVQEQKLWDGEEEQTMSSWL